MTHLAVPPFRCPQSHQNRTWRVYRWFNPHQWILKSTSTLKEISGSGFRLPYGLVWTCFENLGKILRSSCSVLSVRIHATHNPSTLHLCNFEFHEIWKNQWSCLNSFIHFNHSFSSPKIRITQKKQKTKHTKKQKTKRHFLLSNSRVWSRHGRGTRLERVTGADRSKLHWSTHERSVPKSTWKVDEKTLWKP